MNWFDLEYLDDKKHSKPLIKRTFNTNKSHTAFISHILFDEMLIYGINEAKS